VVRDLSEALKGSAGRLGVITSGPKQCREQVGWRTNGGGEQVGLPATGHTYNIKGPVCRTRSTTKTSGDEERSSRGESVRGKKVERLRDDSVSVNPSHSGKPRETRSVYYQSLRPQFAADLRHGRCFPVRYGKDWNQRTRKFSLLR
jgi:hypothetical protein